MELAIWLRRVEGGHAECSMFLRAAGRCAGQTQAPTTPQRHPVRSTCPPQVAPSSVPLHGVLIPVPSVPVHRRFLVHDWPFRPPADSHSGKSLVWMHKRPTPPQSTASQARIQRVNIPRCPYITSSCSVFHILNLYQHLSLAHSMHPSTRFTHALNSRSQPECTAVDIEHTSPTYQALLTRIIRNQ